MAIKQSPIPLFQFFLGHPRKLTETLKENHNPENGVRDDVVINVTPMVAPGKWRQYFCVVPLGAAISPPRAKERVIRNC